MRLRTAVKVIVRTRFARPFLLARAMARVRRTPPERLQRYRTTKPNMHTWIPEPPSAHDPVVRLYTPEERAERQAHWAAVTARVVADAGGQCAWCPRAAVGVLPRVNEMITPAHWEEPARLAAWCGECFARRRPCPARAS